MTGATGGLLLSAPLAVVAGLLSFASPCVLPLVPGYLGYVGGAERATDGGRRRVVLGAALFVLGFSVVFVGTSIAFGSVGFLLVQHLDVVLRVAGVVVILLGLVFVGLLGPFQRRFEPLRRPRAGLVGAPLLGIAFGVGWAPCTGPMLFTIQTMALTGGSRGAAIVLGVLYSVGLGLPFVLLAVGFGWASRAVGAVRRHIRAVNLAGGALLVAVGVLMVTGVWNAVVTALQVAMGGYVSPV